MNRAMHVCISLSQRNGFCASKPLKQRGESSGLEQSEERKSMEKNPISFLYSLNFTEMFTSTYATASSIENLEQPCIQIKFSVILGNPSFVNTSPSMYSCT